ncbi:MAG TPA: galactokinase [Roseiflexaceae bacterium]|nr:galactokinase [Roseiflexaceae bacterium]
MIDPNIVRDLFQRRFGIHPRLIVRAPGRVNLIGEHTDYNDGFVFPAAIDRATLVAARPRTDRLVHVVAADYDAEDEFSLDTVEFSTTTPWSNYIRGVVKALQVAGHTLGGANLLITSDIPRGAGLSSSAALEVAVGYSFQILNKLNILGEALALLAQGAENSFVGVQCGIMDQFISALGQANHALLLDCRDLNYRPVPIPPDVRLIVCDSHIERTLAGSAYNQRRSECEQAVRLLRRHLPKITALRDVSPEQFAALQAELPEPVRARARHVVSENDRVVRSAAALEAGDVATFGRLMNESHASLRDDYEVSIPAMDALVAAAQQVPGCYGSRLTGAGFGGCTISLVDPTAVDLFRSSVAEAYRHATGHDATIYVCRASNGVGRAGSDT